MFVAPEIDFEVKTKRRKLLQSTPKRKWARTNPITPMEERDGDNGLAIAISISFINEKDIIEICNDITTSSFY